MKFQESIRCTIIRGGTSKGIYILRNELPSDPVLRDKVILSIFGSPDIRQIDGLGGADLLTSKLAIVGASTHPDADVDYTFGQVGILEPKVDYSGNCGNLSTGVGPFAIYHGLVNIKEPYTVVKIHLTNTSTLIKAEIPIKDGELAVEGDCHMDGCPGTGARIMIDFSDFGGDITNKILPTGNAKDVLTVEGIGEITVSIVDAGNTVVFIHAEDMGLEGTETPFEIDGDADLLEKLERIRSVAAQKLGLVDDWRKATRESQFNPFIALVNSPRAYTDFTTGKTIEPDDFDILARLLFNQRMHKTYPGTGTVCTGTAVKIPGTLANDLAKGVTEGLQEIRIGHPAGIIRTEVAVDMEENQPVLKRAAISRTARLIMDGHVFVRKSQMK
jgi:2-methylaconitate cis-trans-isomerase PrpF